MQDYGDHAIYRYKGRSVSDYGSETEDGDFRLLLGVGEDIVTAYTGLDEEVTVPDYVAVIADNAFAGGIRMHTLNLPKSVIRIGENAFKECDCLKRINYDGTLEDWCKMEFGSPVINSGGGAELYISGKKVSALVFDRSFKQIPSFAFANLASLEVVSVTGGEIGERAFFGCGNLKKAAIGTAVTEIGEGAFCGCDPSDGFTVEKGNPRYCAVGDCLIEPRSRRIIAGTSKSVIPDGGIEEIADYAFKGCSFEKSDLPEGVKIIGEHAFADCESLTKIVLPSTLEKISDRAFEYCTSLESVTVPQSVREIGENPFLGCNGLKRITVERANTAYRAEGSCIIENRSSRLICGSSKSEAIESVAEIADYAFCDLSSLTRVGLSNGLEKAGDCAFAYCGIEEITLPRTLNETGYGVFMGCERLKSVTFYGMTKLGENAFLGCELSLITAPKEFKKYYKEYFKSRKSLWPKLKIKFVK